MLEVPKDCLREARTFTRERPYQKHEEKTRSVSNTKRKSLRHVAMVTKRKKKETNDMYMYLSWVM